MERSVFRVMKWTDAVTLLNAIFGFMAIFYRHLAPLFITLAFIIDSVDGPLSRRFTGSTKLGKELDSLSDLVSFGIAPLFLLSFRGYEILFPLVYLIGGILRLGYFNTLSLSYFIGLPIPAAALTIVILSVAGINTPWAYLLLGILMVTPLRIRKLRI